MPEYTGHRHRRGSAAVRRAWIRRDLDPRYLSGLGDFHPLIHHHFGSKEDLYVAVKRHMVEGYARRFPVAARAPNRPLSVRAEMRRLVTYLSENEVMFRLLLLGRLEGDIKVWPGGLDLLDTLRSRIKAAQRRNLIRTDLDAATLSVMILGLIYVWVENRAHFAERFKGPSTTRPSSARPSPWSSKA